MERFSLWGNSSDLRRLPLSFEHHLAKAKRMAYGDWEIVASYEKAKTEHRALTREVGVMDLSFFTFVRVSGSDRLESLNRQVSTDIMNLKEGDGRRALLLNDQGGIIADIEVVMMHEALLLITVPTMPADRLIAILSRNLLTEDVEFEDASEHLVALTILGENKGWLARALGVEAPGVDGASMKSSMIGDMSVNILRSEMLGKALMILTKEKFASGVWKAMVAGARELGGCAVGWEAFTAWRIERGMLWHGLDFDEDVIPQDAGLEHAVTRGKTGYAGADEMLRHVGKPSERTYIGLIIDAAEAPPKDAPVHFPEGMAAGSLKSVGFSYSQNKYVGLAVIKKRDPLPYSPMIIHLPDLSLEAKAVTLPFPIDLFESEDDTF
jgi:aminomethyltransferase